MNKNSLPQKLQIRISELMLKGMSAQQALKVASAEIQRMRTDKK